MEAGSTNDIEVCELEKGVEGDSDSSSDVSSIASGTELSESSRYDSLSQLEGRQEK